MPRLDHLSKSLPIECIPDIVAPFLPDVTDIVSLPTELALPPRLQVDTVYRAMQKGHPCIIHIEMQSRSDVTMPRRIYQYAAMLNNLNEEDIPVYSVVIWFTGSQQVESVYRVLHDGSEVNRWQYRNITVYTMTKEQIISQGIGLLPFAAFAKDMQEEDAVPFARLVQAHTPLELGTVLANIYVAMMQQRFPTIDPVDVLQKVGISMNAIEEILWNSSLSDGVKARIAKESEAKGLAKGIAKGLVKGKAKGIAEGKAEGKAEGIVAGKAEGIVAGKAEGKAEGLVTAIRAFWPSKFTEPLPENILVQLRSLSIDQLEAIIQHFTDDDPATILARIHLHA